jgi:hypothetical protein
MDAVNPGKNICIASFREWMRYLPLYKRIELPPFRSIAECAGYYICEN